MDNKNLAEKILTYTFTVFLFCIGADKILQTNLITDWQLLVGPFTHFLLPLSAGSIVMVEGAIELSFGILLLTRWKGITLILLAATILPVIGDLFYLHYKKQMFGNNIKVRDKIKFGLSSFI